MTARWTASSEAFLIFDSKYEVRFVFGSGGSKNGARAVFGSGGSIKRFSSGPGSGDAF
jgi:hypothetical protein